MSLTAYIAAIPKVELHVHLEGSIRPRTLLRLAQRNGVALPAADEAGLQEMYRFVDFMHFIRTYVLISSTLATADDFALIARDFGAEMARQNIRYAEATFTPVTHIERGVPLEVLFEGLDAGRSQARAEHGVEIRWVFDIVRSFPATAEACLAAAIAGQDHGVIGLGLGGPEAGFPPEPFAGVFERARAAGLHSLPHAGEVAGPESVWSALRLLGAERIGHGVRSVEDPALLQHLTRHRIHLEVCPTSNVQTCVCPSYQEHPLPQLLDAGVSLGISTDARTISNITLNEEYRRLEEAFGWGAGEFYACNREALSASFVDDDIKNDLSSRLDAAYVQNSKVHA